MFISLKRGFFLFIIMTATLQVNAMYRTTETGRNYIWSFSPYLMGMGMGYNGASIPSSIAINPASNAFIQRVMLEFSYGVTPALFTDWQNTNEKFMDGGDFFLPFAINTGFVIPSRYGNFSLAADYVNSSNRDFAGIGIGSANNNDIGAGKMGTLYFAYSKDFLNVFAFGFGGNLKFSYNPNAFNKDYVFDVGFGFDLGIIFKPEVRFPFVNDQPTNWAFQDLQISLILKDVGKPLVNTRGESSTVNGVRDINWFTALPTLATGVSFNLYNNGVTYWKILFDATFPFFQNFTFACGTEIEIFNFFAIRGSYTFDLEGTLEYAGVINNYEYIYNIFNFTGGISFRFTANSFKHLTKSEVEANSFKNTEFSIDLGFQPYFQGVKIMAGCTITIGALDQNPPVVVHRQQDYYISPDNNGIKDNLVVDLDITDERYITYWSFEVYNSNDQLVRRIEGREPRLETIKFEEAARIFFSPKTGIPIPSRVVWDGRNDMGSIVPDGQYRYKFYAKDDNGNTDENGSLNGFIIVDTSLPVINHHINQMIFSPDGDGNQDMIIIELDIVRAQVPCITILEEEFNFQYNRSIDYSERAEAVRSEIVTGFDQIIREQRWYVDVLNQSDELIRRFVFSERGSVRVQWDGKNENGEQVPDGVYKIKLWSINDAGSRSERFINNIIIDTVPRPIVASLTDQYFSPNNNEIKDTIKFAFDIPVKDGLNRWQLVIKDGNGRTVRTYEENGLPPSLLEWDGKNQSGSIASEGVYKAVLTAYYENGSTPTSTTPDFILDNTAPASRIALSTKIFRPGSENAINEVTITHTGSTNEDMWTGRILNSLGQAVKTYSWRGQPPNIAWGGIDDNGNLLADGMYYYQLNSTDRAGNTYTSERFDLTTLATFENAMRIDTRDVPVFLSYVNDCFGPNNNGIKDIQTFMIRANITENRVINWKFSVKNFDTDSTVFELTQNGDLRNRIDWDGKANGTAIAPDGLYYGVLSVNFQNGANTTTKTTSFILDNIAPNVEIAIVNSIISPDGDTFLDATEILQRGSREDLWESAVYDSQNNLVFSTYLQNSEPAQKYIWDGRDINGNVVTNGIYRYVISSTDRAGNTGKAEGNVELKNVRTNTFLTTNSSGFSPDGNGLFDNIEFSPTISVRQGIIAYSFEILDNSKNIVFRNEGESDVPAKIIWDGKNRENVRLPDGRYSARLTVIYNFGNRPVAETGQFILDTTPPQAVISYNPGIFSPDNDGVDDQVAINFNVNDLSGVSEWSLRIMSPNKSRVFYQLNGRGLPASSINWNGRSTEGDLVESAEDYPVAIKFTDNLGNTVEREVDPLMVDILVMRLSEDKLKILISNIEFEPDSHIMTSSPRNERIIQLLSRALRKYNQYNILIEGHANRFREGLDENLARNLSMRRADHIKGILVRNGIAAGRMTAVGRGFDNPIVPLGEGVTIEELSKNRRVEFYLDKNK